jgi:hypothetical protein
MVQVFGLSRQFRAIAITAVAIVTSGCDKKPEETDQPAAVPPVLNTHRETCDNGEGEVIVQIGEDAIYTVEQCYPNGGCQPISGYVERRGGDLTHPGDSLDESRRRDIVGRLTAIRTARPAPP